MRTETGVIEQRMMNCDTATVVDVRHLQMEQQHAVLDVETPGAVGIGGSKGRGRVPRRSRDRRRVVVKTHRRLMVRSAADRAVPEHAPIRLHVQDIAVFCPLKIAVVDQYRFATIRISQLQKIKVVDVRIWLCRGGVLEANA